MNYQKTILVGNATADPQERKAKKGNLYYTTFTLGIRGSQDETTFFPITVISMRAKAPAKYITKGKEVLVEGRIQVSDQGRFTIIADWIRLGSMPSPPLPVMEGE